MKKIYNSRNYYEVKAKCGHVGRNNYIIKTFAIIAESGKGAAATCKWTPRVKHHDKKAIIEVNMINYEEYKQLKNKNDNDFYLKCKNIQQQRYYCDLFSDILKELNSSEVLSEKDNRLKRLKYIMKKNRSLIKSLKYDNKLYNQTY